MTGERKHEKKSETNQRINSYNIEKDLKLDNDSELYKQLKEQFDLEEKLIASLANNNVKETSRLLSILNSENSDKSKKYPYFDMNNANPTSDKYFNPGVMIWAKKLKDQGFLTMEDLLYYNFNAFGEFPVNREAREYCEGLVTEITTKPTVEEINELAYTRKDESIDSSYVNYDVLKLIPFLNEYIKSTKETINPQIIKLLLENGADVNKEFSYGKDNSETPLMLLVKKQCSRSIKEDKQSYNQYINNIKEIINLFLDEGIDLNQIDKEGINILYYCCKNFPSRDLFDFLLEQGAKVIEYEAPYLGYDAHDVISPFKYAKALGFKDSDDMKQYVKDFHKNRKKDIEGEIKNATNLISDLASLVTSYTLFSKPLEEKKPPIDINELLKIWEENKNSLCNPEKIHMKDFIDLYKEENVLWPNKQWIIERGEEIIERLEHNKNYEGNNFDQKTKDVIDRIKSIISKAIEYENNTEVKLKK